MKRDIQPATEVLMDNKPDERGNVMIAAVFDSESMIALTLNAN